MNSFDRNLILIADDDKQFVDEIKIYLQDDIPDAEFITVCDGNACLALFERSNPRPGIIILDMMMPKRSGFLVLEKMRRTYESDPERPPFVIMVTINEGARHKAYAEMLGVFRFMRKPFHQDRLLAAVQDARCHLT